MTCRELIVVSTVAQVSYKLQHGATCGCLQHLASQFHVAVEVTSTKALKMFCNTYVCDQKNTVNLLLERLVRKA